MKKVLLVLFGLTTMFGINQVHAAEFRLEYDTNIEEINSLINNIGYHTVQEQIIKMIEIYNSEYSKDYPFFYISFWKHGINGGLMISSTMFTEISSSWIDYFSTTTSALTSTIPFSGSVIQLDYEYDMSSNNFIESDSVGISRFPILIIDPEKSQLFPYSYYYSNFDLYYRGSLLGDYFNISFINIDDNLFIPTFNSSSSFSIHKPDSDFLIEPYYLYDNNLHIKDETYISIDLNQYEYVALSLKDYNTIPSNNMSSYTYFYVKGQLCITPVYNYGLTERKDILTGTQIQGCSQYYDDFTANKVFILRDDVINHAIYYLKAHDTTKDNIVKIDSNKFDITYITEETKDNPQVIIGGKTYPTLSYDSLTDTSTKSEDEGYVPGVSCTLGDLNCYIQNNPENVFDSIFSSPLQFMQDIWDSVTSIFSLITEFISLLPPIMQSFLYLSFMVAIILGLLKIIL